MGTPVSMVNQALTVLSSALSADQISAYNYSLGWSQAVARNTSADPSSQAYFDSMTQELSRVAWMVLASYELDYRQSSSTSPADAIQQLLTGIQNQVASPVQRLFSALQAPRLSASSSSALATWWQRTQVTANVTSMIIGPLFPGPMGMSTALTFIDFNYASDSWQSLFVKQSASRLSVTAKRVEMSFLPAIWSTIGADVEAKLAASAATFIRQVDLDI